MMDDRPRAWLVAAALGASATTVGVGVAAGAGCGGAATNAVASSPPPRSSRAASGAAASPRSRAAPRPAVPRCTPDPSVPSPWDVPEASGAAMVELVPGRRVLLVVSDSGNAGAALAYDPTASTFRSLKLPLDAAASDDVEGVAWRDGALFTLTSSGAVRVFHPDGRGGLAASGPSYRLGAPPASCPNLSEANCGKNWEGLCLRASGSGGWAASKTEGTLYPVAVVAAGSSKRLALDPARAPLHLGDLEAHALSDCSFGPGDRLLVTTNLHGGAVSYVVDEATGAAAEIAAPGTLSNEVIVVDDSGALYQLEDDNGEVSGAVRAKCTW